ncbi:MAG TPA: DNA methyltransferase [Ktedonobacteraceae bacterium]|nr:DNA methyltransferase [Ktedonobacteraceae bacterium]
MPDQRTYIKGTECQAGKYAPLDRRFAIRLRREQTFLAATIEGIEDGKIRARYASLLLYRLMFLYLAQQYGLFAGDRNYLFRQLARAQEQTGDGKAFYRDCLRPLFAGVIGTEEWRIPLATLFIEQTVERNFPAIALPDQVFVGIFALLEDYCGADRYHAHITALEIMSALFEQEMSSKDLGAYYTPVDVAYYIARNTLMPALFARIASCYPQETPLEEHIWQQFIQQPERYIFPAAGLGWEQMLPEEISEGLQDSTRRAYWQRIAPPAYGHPKETWRDVITRHAHLREILAELGSNESKQIKRLVTWNLDQLKLARDTLYNCQQPLFLEAFYRNLRMLTVLDPTCGSGAFLCVALQVLEPLYMACLTCMQEWLSPCCSQKIEPALRQLFQTYLEEAGNPAQWQRTILYWIIKHNLYGVDLMEEAVEICRLRLFLTILTGATPLPERASGVFAQNIYVGNSLTGPLSPSDQPVATTRANRSQAGQAFVWSQIFPEPMKRGGFDVILGNPPYVEYERVRPSYEVTGYTTLNTGNLYAFTIERSFRLLAPGGRFGMIVPASATCTDGYRSLQKLLREQQELHVASFSDQRGRLFALPHARLCIILSEKATSPTSLAGQIFATPYLKLERAQRANLFERIYYTEVTQQARPGIIPRFGSPLERAIASKLAQQSHNLAAYFRPASTHRVYYTRKLSWFVQITPFIPLIRDEQGQTRAPSELKFLSFAEPLHARLAFAALNSSLFYWLLTTSSDCRNLNLREIKSLPLDLALISSTRQQKLWELSLALESDLLANSLLRQMTFRGQGRLTIQCLYPVRSRHLIDEIDQVLAEHYGFTTEELDFLLSYDGKYRQPRR